jgi:O-antigen/teichoic acid export membrane protein
MAAGVIVLGAPRLQTLRLASPLDRHERRRLLELGISGVTTAIMYWVISSSDRWFIGFFRDQNELGLYSFGTNIGMLGLVLNTALTAAWFPEITQSYERHEGASSPETLGHEWARLVSSLLLVWLAVAASGGDIIRLLAHPRFHDSARYVPWVAGGVFFYGVATLAVTGLWISQDLKPTAYWWFAGAILSIGLNIVLVPRWGSTGAAVTACLSYAFIASGILWSAHHLFALRIRWSRLGASAVLVLAVGVFMSLPWHSNAFLSLCLKLPTGAAVSGVVLYASSPDWLRRTVVSAISTLRRLLSVRG